MKQYLSALAATAIFFYFSPQAFALPCSDLFASLNVSPIARQLERYRKASGLQILKEKEHYIQLLETSLKVLPENDKELVDAFESEDLRKVFMSAARYRSRDIKPDDLRLLAKSNKLMTLYKATLAAADLWLLSKHVFDQIYLFSESQAGVWHFTKEPLLKDKFKRLAQDLIYPVLKAGLPGPMPDPLTPTSPIFHKLWQNANYQPSAAEWEILKKYKAVERFEIKQAFMNQHPTWTQFRRYLGYTYTAALGISTALVFNHFNQQLKSGLISLDDYLNNSAYEIKDNQIHIINDTVPFPHTAIRIGDRVYSYGQTHMSSMPLTEYLRHREIQELLRRRLNSEDSSSGSQSSAEDKLSKLFTKSGLAKLHQSVQVFTINLSAEEVLDLKRYLIKQTGKRYKNITLINDCTTMALRAIESNTSLSRIRLIDASPTQTGLYFSLRKTLGDTRFGPVYQVAIDAPEEPFQHLLRNTWLNVVESKLFIRFFHLNQAQRTYLELKYDDEDLQSYSDPAIEMIFEQWKQEAINLVLKDPQMEIFWEKIKNRQERPQDYSANDHAQLRRSIGEYMQEKVSLAKEDRHERHNDLRSLTLSQYRWETLMTETKKMLATLDAISKN